MLHKVHGYMSSMLMSWFCKHVVQQWCDWM